MRRSPHWPHIHGASRFFRPLTNHPQHWFYISMCSVRTYIEASTPYTVLTSFLLNASTFFSYIISGSLVGRTTYATFYDKQKLHRHALDLVNHALCMSAIIPLQFLPSTHELKFGSANIARYIVLCSIFVSLYGITDNLWGTNLGHFVVEGDSEFFAV